MRKVVSPLLAVMFALALAACDTDEGPIEERREAAESATDTDTHGHTAPAAPAPADPAAPTAP